MAADLADAVPTAFVLADIYESYLRMFWIETDAPELLAEFSAPTLVDDVRGQAPHDLMVKDFIAAESFPTEFV